MGLLSDGLLCRKQTVSLDEKAAALDQLNLPVGRGIAQLPRDKDDLQDPTGETASRECGIVLLGLSRTELCTCRTLNTVYHQPSGKLQNHESIETFGI